MALDEARLVYFLRVWEDLWGNAADDPAHDLIGPEFGIIFLREELGLSRLQNTEVRDLLSRCFSVTAQDDAFTGADDLLAILELLKAKVKEGRSAYVSTLSNQAYDRFSNGEYVEAVIVLLRALLEDSVVFDAAAKTRLRWLCNQLIAACVLRGRDPRWARGLFRNIFFARAGMVNNQFVCDYPVDALPDPEPVRGASDSDRFGHLFSEAFANLSIDDRFSGFTRMIVERDDEPFSRIFSVNGLKGTTEFTLGDVTFYPPHSVQKLKPDRDIDETFGRPEKDALNVIVTVTGGYSEAAEERAISRVQNAIDILGFNASPYMPIEIRTDTILLARPDGSWAGIHGSAPRRHDAISHQYMALELDQLAKTDTAMKMKESADAILRRGTGPKADQRLETALRAIRKADGASVLEDRLVSYWIGIEALLSSGLREGFFVQDPGRDNAEDIALSIVPAVYMNAGCYTIAGMLLSYLRHIVYNERNDAYYEAAIARVGQDLRLKSGVIPKPWSTFDLSDLVSRLDEWLACVPAGNVVHDVIQRTRDFYSDNSAARKELFARRLRARDEIIVIYQMRNRIVHSAFFQTAAIRYFAARAKLYATMLLDRIMSRPGETAVDVLTSEVALTERLLKRLDPGGRHVDLLCYR